MRIPPPNPVTNEFKQPGSNCQHKQKSKFAKELEKAKREMR